MTPATTSSLGNGRPVLVVQEARVHLWIDRHLETAALLDGMGETEHAYANYWAAWAVASLFDRRCADEGEGWPSFLAWRAMVRGFAWIESPAEREELQRFVAAREHVRSGR